MGEYGCVYSACMHLFSDDLCDAASYQAVRQSGFVLPHDSKRENGACCACEGCSSKRQDCLLTSKKDGSRIININNK